MRLKQCFYFQELFLKVSNAASFLTQLFITVSEQYNNALHCKPNSSFVK